MGRESILTTKLIQAFQDRKIDARYLPLEEAIANDLPDLAGLIIVHATAPLAGLPWNQQSETDLQAAFSLTKHAAAALRPPQDSQQTVFATIISLDGQFGFANTTADFDPIIGGLSALAKTVGIEWSHTTSKAIDLHPDLYDQQSYGFLIDELLTKNDPEVGYTKDGRTILRLVEETEINEGGPANIQPDDLIVVTGGARGITAKIAISLAQQFNPRFVLLGRSAAPQPLPPWYLTATSDQAIKQEIIAHHFQTEKATPSKVDAIFRHLKANQEILDTLNELKTYNPNTRYYSLDVRSQSDMKTILEEIQFHHPIRGLIHAAGVLEDKLILDKQVSQFQQVFGTKIEGLRNLLAAIDITHLHTVILFSSVSARAGNKGQVDYAMANEVLNKLGSWLKIKSPKMHVLSANWGPWDGGMVTPSLKSYFKSAGVNLIDIAGGCQALTKELANPSNSVEIVFGDTFDDAKKAAPGFPISLQSLPILDSHVIGGKAVVPLALMMGWITDEALKLHPDCYLVGLDDIQVLNGIRLTTQPSHITFSHLPTHENNDQIIQPVSIGDTNKENRLHAKANVILSRKSLGTSIIPWPTDIIFTPYQHSMQTVYRDILFHGKQLHAIQSVNGIAAEGILAALSPAPAPQNWIKQSDKKNWTLDPLVLDGAFQMAILWGHHQYNQLSLPIAGGSYRQYQPFSGTTIETQMQVTEVKNQVMHGNFVFKNDQGQIVATLNHYQAIMDPSLTSAFKHTNIH